MVRALNHIFLLSIVAVIVAVSGCSSNTFNSSNTSNNTQAPATATPETQAMPVETPTLVSTPVSIVETPGATENTTSFSRIEQSNAGVTSAVSNGTLTVKVSENSYGLETNPFSTAKKKTNPFNNTGNNNLVATDKGKLNIIPANDSTTNTTGNQTVNMGTQQRKLQTVQAAQSGSSGTGTAQNSTGNVTVNTTSNGNY